MKKYIRLIIVVLLLFIVIPVIIYLLTVIPILPNSSNNDWAGFWGGYMGAILGGIITLYVMRNSIENSRKDMKYEQKIQYFDKLITVSSKYIQVNANMCRCMAHSFNSYNEQTYNSAVEAMNLAATMRTELFLLLETREKMYDLKEVIERLRGVEKQSEILADLYENIGRKVLKGHETSEIELIEYLKGEKNLLSKLGEIETAMRTTVEYNLRIQN